MSVLLFISIILANWRLTHLFSKEDGPFDMIYRLRIAAGSGFWGKLLDCFYCTSVWVSLPFGLYAGKDVTEKLIYWAAFSGAACLLEQMTSQQQTNKNILPDFKEDEPCVTVEAKETL